MAHIQVLYLSGILTPKPNHPSIYRVNKGGYFDPTLLHRVNKLILMIKDMHTSVFFQSSGNEIFILPVIGLIHGDVLTRVGPNYSNYSVFE